MADIKWTIFADASAAERSIQSLEQKYAKLENAITQIGRKQKQSSDSVVSSLKGQIGSVASLAAGYLSLATAITTAFEKNREFIRLADEASLKLDEMSRKFRIQGGLTALQGASAQKSIQAAAVAAGFSSEQAFQAATQMVSSGATPEEAQGKGLEVVLKTMAASNLFGRGQEGGPPVADPTALAKAMTSYLNSQGLKLSPDNYEKIGMGVQRAFKNTDILLPDLVELAQIGSVLKGRLSQEEQIAAMAGLKTEGGLAGADAATQLRNTVLFSATSKGHVAEEKALRKMGLKPEDVDFVGETFTDVLKRYQQGLSKLKPEQVLPTLETIFGKRSVTGAKNLIDNVGLLEERQKVLGDKNAFESDVAVATSGRAAGNRRLIEAEQQQLADRAGKYSDVDVKRSFGIAAREGGMSEARISLNQLIYDAYRTAGAEQETALSAIGSRTSARVGANSRDNSLQERTNQLLEESLKAQQEQTGVLKAAAENRALNRNAQGEGAP